jgi:hypothetical protein
VGTIERSCKSWIKFKSYTFACISLTHRLSLQDAGLLRVYGNSKSTRVDLFTSLSILIYEHETSFQNYSISSPHSWLQYSALPQTVGTLLQSSFWFNILGDYLQ